MNYDIQFDIADPSFIDIDLPMLHQTAVRTLEYTDCADTSLTIVITNNDYVRSLNAQYRGIDSPTDVLSFATEESEDVSELPPELVAEMGDYLGDLIIAYPFTQEQAARYGNPLDAELRLLVVHGILHLLGYDHDTEIHQADMWQMQGAILQSLGDSQTNWEREYES